MDSCPNRVTGRKGLFDDRCRIVTVSRLKATASPPTGTQDTYVEDTRRCQPGLKRSEGMSEPGWVRLAYALPSA